MNKKLPAILLASLTLLLFITSCSSDDDKDISGDITGMWQQQDVSVDGVSSISACEKEMTLFVEANGVYRMFDPCSNGQHSGTWIVSDGNWLSMSMDKIIGKDVSGAYRFGQVLVRFTVLSVNNNELELRIKTFTNERKTTVMFSLQQQDLPPATTEDAMKLDNENKTLHTYIYKFKRVQL